MEKFNAERLGFRRRCMSGTYAKIRRASAEIPEKPKPCLVASSGGFPVKVVSKTFQKPPIVMLEKSPPNGFGSQPRRQYQRDYFRK